ncbi:MAG: hypothetical protein ACRED9_04730 [Caulobacteraceae bacterium]
MYGQTASSERPRKRRHAPSLHYRGVKLQTPATPPRTPLSKLQQALDKALAKHADALAGGK